ncbi:MAG: Arc family DNA-binding protein [Actinomycetota bacterium]
MIDVPTLHIRNVPKDVYEGLRERALERGTSMNTEVIEILDEAFRYKKRSFEEVMASLEALSKEINFGPDWPAPEDVIRADRDSH